MTPEDLALLRLGSRLMLSLWEKMGQELEPDPERLWLALALAARMAERGVQHTCETLGPPGEMERMRERLQRLLVACDANCDALDASADSKRPQA